QPNVFSQLGNLKAQISKTEKFNQAIAFLRSLRSAMEALALDPILVDTGQHEPIYDKPRTYQDVQNEIANMLVGLPDYTARVRIKDDTEHIIQTIQPEKGVYGKLLQERIARIQAQNRADGYVRERVTVEGEITKRQSQ